MTRPDVHDYLEYRSFLRDALAFEKAQGRIAGHRDVAGYLGLKSPGHITWILQGKRNLVERLLDPMSKLLGLDAREREYFQVLVRHNDEMVPDDRRRHMAQLSRLQAGRKHILSDKQFLYWTSWRHAVVRELVAIESFRRSDLEAIAARLEPTVSVEEVERSLELLEDLGMVEVDAAGVLHRSESILSSGENWSVESIRGYQKSILDLAARALADVPRERRDISTVTFSVSRERLQKIRTRIQDMRQEILALVRTDPNPEEIFHLAVELFPATRSGGAADA